MCYREGRGVVPPPEFVPQGRYPEFRVRTWEFTPQTEPCRTQWFYLAIYLADFVDMLYTYILAGHKYFMNDFILRAVSWSKNAKEINSDKVAISSDKVTIKWTEIKERCSPNTIKILEYLSKNESISNAIARDITGLSSPGVRRILSNLVESKIVGYDGKNKSRTYHLEVEFILD